MAGSVARVSDSQDKAVSSTHTGLLSSTKSGKVVQCSQFTRMCLHHQAVLKFGTGQKLVTPCRAVKVTAGLASHRPCDTDF